MKGDIIDSYRRLPIGKYMEIGQVCREESDELNKQVRIISILTDMSEDDILNLPIVEYQRLAEKSRFLETIEDRDASRIAKSYRVGDFELVPVSHHRDVNTAQYIDFQEYAKQGEDYLVETLSCLMIPKGRKYNRDYDVLKVQEAIRENLPVSDVLALIAFFLLSLRALIVDSLSYCREEAKKVKDPEKRREILERIQEQEMHLRTNGVG